MRAGKKHVALFVDLKPEGYEEMIASDEYASFEFERNSGDFPIPYYIVYRKTHAYDAKELLEIVTIPNPGWYEALERRTGEILSYPQEAIEYFIKALKEKQLLK